MGDDALDVLASELLASAALSFAPSPPARQFVSWVGLDRGGPAWDCDSLVVHMNGLRWTRGLEGAAKGLSRPGVGHALVVIRFHVTLIRCGAPVPGPRGQAPTAEVIDEHAALMLTDLWRCARYLKARFRAGDLFGDALSGCCEAVDFEAVEPLGPQGAMAAWRLIVSATFSALP